MPDDEESELPLASTEKQIPRCACLPAQGGQARHGGPAAGTLGMTTKHTPFYRAGTAEREMRPVRTVFRLRNRKKRQAWNAVNIKWTWMWTSDNCDVPETCWIFVP